MKNKITLVLLPLIIFIFYIALTSSSGGINGQSVAGCTCHGAASPSTIVTITGLPAGGYTNSTVYPITVSVTNTTFAGSAGFDLTSTAGTFTAVAGTALNGALEIRHNAPKARVSGTASWTFNWTAPPTGSANVSFFLSGNAVNGNGNTTGDIWNQISTTIYKAGAVLNVTATNTAITCNGGFSTITASASGPTQPYTYSRNGGAFQSSGTFTNNLAGVYTITVRDATLATASTTLNITQPNLLVMGTTSNTPIICNGGTCTVTTSATGGTGTINYRLNAGVYQSSGTFNSVLAGTYTVTARDANLCTKTTVLVITQPSAMVFNNTAATQPLCNNGSNGSVTRTVTGGTGTKTYTINPLGPQTNTTGVFTGLIAQTYTVTATDASNCTKTTAVIIGQPSAINFISPVATPPLCNGGVGIISSTATGGVGAKTYTINPGGTSNSTGTFTGLSAQSYTISVSDANGCTKSTTVILTQPSALSLNIATIQNPICNGGNDGSLSIVATGGTGSITYSIAPLGPQTNSSGNFTGLSAQTFTITARDANNCSITSSVTLSQPPPVSVTALDVSGCLGDSITLVGIPAGGVFSIPNPYLGYSTTYSYTITDGNGCTNSDIGHIYANSVIIDSVVSSPSSICTGGTTYLSVKPAKQNCIPITTTNNCSGIEFISNVQLGSINHSTTCADPGYNDFSSTQSTNLIAGNSYPISLSDGNYFAGDYWAVWVDLNHNGVYGDEGELTTFAATGTTTQANIYIPTTAYNGTTKMRVRLVYLGPISPCDISNWGETEDYGIVITGGTNNSNSAFSYSWSGATTSTLVTPNAQNTYANNIVSNETYEVTVSSAEGCTAIATSTISTFNETILDSVIASPSNVCPGGSSVIEAYPISLVSSYCSADNANNGCTSLEFIQNVNFGSINNTTICDNIGYKDYTSISTNISAGSTYSISLTDGFFFAGDSWGVWIDYNQNGSFNDAGEFNGFTASGAITTGNIAIPANAYNGPTRMRVRLMFASNLQPCGISSWGEVEDYTVNITNGIVAPPFITYNWSSVSSTLNSTTTNPVTANNIASNDIVTLEATRRDGCKQTQTTAININCGATVNLKLFLQGYYNTTSLMLPTLFNQGESLNTNITDSITIELRNSNPPYQVIESKNAILNIDGTASAVFSNIGSYYIAINHRNTVQTWSASPLNITGTVNYDFSDAQTKSYGGNMTEIESGVWAMFSGDVNQDENTDLLDLGFVETDITGFAFGYFPTDINGDGNVDLLDTPIVEVNVSNFIFSSHP